MSLKQEAPLNQHQDFETVYRIFTNVRGANAIKTTTDQWLKFFPGDMIRVIKSQGGESIVIMKLAVKLGLKALEALEQEKCAVYQQNGKDRGFVLNYIFDYYQHGTDPEHKEYQELAQWRRRCVEQTLLEIDSN